MWGNEGVRRVPGIRPPPEWGGECLRAGRLSAGSDYPLSRPLTTANNSRGRSGARGPA